MRHSSARDITLVATDASGESHGMPSSITGPARKRGAQERRTITLAAGAIGNAIFDATGARPGKFLPLHA